jgi:homopolymeric O-antigen transport system ATP-binding protein
MSNIAVRVQDLGKQYFIGEKKKQSVFLAESLKEAFKDPFRRLGRRRGKGPAEGEKPFWALKDVCFELKHGEVLGIIGRNGSGKSTLLKIMSNVLEPTTGRVELYGRVGSLLEVGMGFHPELTGRENIYLSGAIMGMKRTEIDRKLDEIIDFSGIEEFVDTPVKRYSSGMYVRLAFSVASQLNLEILLLDEVLAVGDQEFQKKCLRKMHEVAKGGRTVLFVSHGMDSVRQLCDRGILLSEGNIIATGTADEAVDSYLDLIDDSLKAVRLVEKLEDLPRIISRLPHDSAFALKAISIIQDDLPTLDVGNGRPIEIRIEYKVLSETPGLYLFFQLYNSRNILLFESLHNGAEEDLPVVSPGHYVSTGIIPGDYLLSGRHELHIGAAIFGQRACVPEMLRFNLEVNNTGSVNRAYSKRRSHGLLSPLFQWNTDCLDRPKFNASLDPEPIIPVPERKWEALATAPGNDNVRLRAVRVRNREGNVTGEIDSQEPFDVEIEYWNQVDGAALGTTLLVHNMAGECILGSLNNRDMKWHGIPRREGMYKSICTVPGNFFVTGCYLLSFLVWEYGYGDAIRVDDILRINLHESEGSYRGDYTGPHTAVGPVLPWRSELISDEMHRAVHE